jgi:polyisoprenoid-binding protein YceI
MISGWFKTTASAALYALVIGAISQMSAGRANAATWVIDPVHSSVSFSVQHMMLSYVKGEFDKFSGTISANDDDPKSLEIDVTIDASSITTHNDKRDAHVKSPDFLDVAKYPTITFKSLKLEPESDGKWKLTGNLTLHGVTRPVVLEVSGPTPEITVMGAPHRAASATTTINRQDFGVAFNKTLDKGGLVVGNDVMISIEVDAAKKP